MGNYFWDFYSKVILLFRYFLLRVWMQCISHRLYSTIMIIPVVTEILRRIANRIRASTYNGKGHIGQHTNHQTQFFDLVVTETSWKVVVLEEDHLGKPGQYIVLQIHSECSSNLDMTSYFAMRLLSFAVVGCGIRYVLMARTCRVVLCEKRHVTRFGSCSFPPSYSLSRHVNRARFNSRN